MRFLLDTNVLSEPARRRPDAGVMEGFERHEREACTAAPVIHEMVYGIERMGPGPLRADLSAYVWSLLSVPLLVLPYDGEAARWHARERARLERLGLTPAFVDGQIAAVAAVRGLVLVTRNVRQFEAFTDLRIENWFAGDPKAGPR